jgi:hypothetical protein
MLGIGRGESYVIKQSGLWIQRDHTLDLESVLLADGVKGRVLIYVTHCDFFFYYFFEFRLYLCTERVMCPQRKA